MSLQFTEGFDTQASTTDLPFTTTTAISGFVAGRFSGRAASLSPSGSLVRPILPVTTGTIGFAFRLNNEDLACTLAISFLSSTGVNITIVLDATGTVTAYSGSTSGSLLATFSAGFTPYTWAYCAIQSTFDHAVGSIIVNIDGTPTIVVAPVNTSPNSANLSQSISWQFQSASPSSSAYLDDMYFCDKTGIGAFTGFLGVCTINSVLPSGPGRYTHFTPSANANWQNVDEHVMDGDTSYNSSATLTKDTFVGHTTVTTGTLLAVEPEIVARSSIGGSYNIETYLISRSTETGGTAKTLTTNYSRQSDIYVIDPATGKPWTNSAGGTLEFGYNNVKA